MIDLTGFDISKYRKYIHKLCLDLNMSYEERENMVFEILKARQDSFSVTCETCGRSFIIANREHKCKKEDIYLFNYTNRPLENRKIPKKYFERIRKRYPLEESNKGKYAYRGLNFLTKKHYEDFLSQIKDNTLTTKSITSWTIEEKHSRRFARIIQKGTSLEDERRRELVVDALNNKSNITGYKGVIIRTILREEDTLADISDNKFGKFSEKEVILLPGKYTIDVVETINRIEKK